MSEHTSSCPLSAVDRRLEDAHRQWHQAQDAYFDPEEFRLAIQSAIQTLRSVTFIIQSNKKIIPNFESWYQEWQDRLSSDSLMRWMKNARNKIEKQGDLEAKSFVRAKIVYSYDDDGPSIEVPAEITDAPIQLIKNIPEGLLGEHLNRFGTLRIQRRWVENTLPDFELLDAVAIAYGRISELVDDAHRQIGLPAPTTIDICSGLAIPNGYRSGRMPCMILHAEIRSLDISLKDGIPFQVKSIRQPFDRDAAMEGAERYGLDPKNIIGTDLNYASILRNLFDTARVMMVKDKGHVSIMFLLREGKPDKILMIEPKDQGEKYMLMRRIANEVTIRGADGVILIGEVWRAPVSLDNPYMRAADSANRIEALNATLVSKIGDPLQLSAEITRNGEEVCLGETEEDSEGAYYIFSPIYTAWGRKIPSSWSIVGNEITNS